MTIPAEIVESVTLAVEKERRRIVGMVLSEYAIYRLAGEERIARALDALATKIENQPAAPYKDHE